jgi:D-2-hydroxyacid dehydrogenase (NADP+)
MQKSVLIIDDAYAEYYREQLSRRFPAVVFHARPTKEQVGGEADEVDAMLGIGTTRIFSEQLVRRAKRVRWIQAFTTGTDGLIGLSSLRREVVVTSGRGIHGPQVAEMALLLMIALGRDLPRALRNQRKALWERFDQRRIFGKTVVILGVGIIGADLATRAKAFGMRVIGVTRTPRELPGFDRMHTYAQLVAAAAEADYLVVITPYSPQTDKIVNAGIFAAMKPDSYLINVSRGRVCDEDALLQALQENRIAGAGMDAMATEPLPAGHPFWSDPRVIVTPHVSGGSDFSPALLMPIIEGNMKCFLEDRLSEMVNVVPR